MPYALLPDIAIADIAFRAEGKSARALFESCARALTDVMVDRKTVETAGTREVSLEGDDMDRLLYDFLTELIILKDVDSFLFKTVYVRVSSDGKSMSATLKGESIDRKRHRLRNDVKAVTMHMFGIKKARGRLVATIVLDI